MLPQVRDIRPKFLQDYRDPDKTRRAGGDAVICQIIETSDKTER